MPKYQVTTFQVLAPAFDEVRHILVAIGRRFKLVYRAANLQDLRVTPLLTA